MLLEQMIYLNRILPDEEHDGFTHQRYLSLLKYFRPGMTDVLDLGCNIGDGGAALKSRLPKITLTGVDCVPENVEGLDPLVYAQGLQSPAHSVPLAMVLSTQSLPPKSSNTSPATWSWILFVSASVCCACAACC